MERITEIIPIRDHSYPSDHLGDEVTLHDKYEMDMREKARRQTDRKQFTTVNLLEYHDGVYELVNMPSDAMLSEMRSKLDPSQRAAFDADMEQVRKYVEEYKASKKSA